MEIYEYLSSHNETIYTINVKPDHCFCDMLVIITEKIFIATPSLC